MQTMYEVCIFLQDSRSFSRERNGESDLYCIFLQHMEEIPTGGQSFLLPLSFSLGTSPLLFLGKPFPETEFHLCVIDMHFFKRKILQALAVVSLLILMPYHYIELITTKTTTFIWVGWSDLYKDNCLFDPYFQLAHWSPVFPTSSCYFLQGIQT